MKLTLYGPQTRRLHQMQKDYREYDSMTLKQLRKAYKANLPRLYSAVHGTNKFKKHLLIEQRIDKAGEHCMLRGMKRFDVKKVWPISNQYYKKISEHHENLYVKKAIAVFCETLDKVVERELA